MWDFMYEIIETGEEFLVECDNLGEANVILEMSGFEASEIKFCGRFTVEEGEMMGLDTY